MRHSRELVHANDDELDQAVAEYRQALGSAPEGDRVRTVALSRLGLALRDRFRRSGAPEDLDEAVDSCRRAATATPVDHADHPVLMLNLGVTLHTRFERFGAAGDLDEAVAATLQAAAGTGTGHPLWDSTMSNLCVLLRSRSRRNGLLSDLDASVDVQREIVSDVPTGHPDLPAFLTNLATSLRDRFGRTGTPGDLDEAVAAYRRAVDLTPPADAGRAGRLTGLGNALVDRFERTGQPGDLDDAVDACRHAVDLTPAGHSDRTGWLTNFAIAALRRFEHAGDPADAENAHRAAVEAVRVGSAHPSLRIEAARTASTLAMRRGDPAGAADILETAIRLLPDLVSRRLRRPDQQFRLARIAGLAAYAAGAALSDPTKPVPRRAERALELVDAGRAVLLSQSLEIREDLTELHAAHPVLADRFAGLRSLLDREIGNTVHTDPVAGQTRSTTELYLSFSDATSAPDGAERIRLTQELAATLRDIRAQPGFGTFGLPPTVRELAAEAVHGPVVTFTVTEHRCDALILTADRVTSLPLPGLTDDALARQVTAFHTALRGTTGRDLDPVAPAGSAQPVLLSVLEWLWDNVVGPVLDHLGLHRTPAGRWPRVWWVPGGQLGLLPLHAAGHHRDPDTPERRTVLDRVVSSYTPTIRSLRHARRSGATRRPPTRSLIVAMPTTPGLPGGGYLPHVRAEAEILGTLLPGARTLTGDPAASADAPTARRVLDELPSHPIAHFACHGIHDPDPAASRLLLHDHAEAPLTVARLAPVNLERAQLAYLSACDTALSPDNRLVDEATHLASAFQLAGFPHVIGTLWSLDDRFAVEVAARFYRALRDPGTGQLDTGRAAYALHDVIRSERDRHPGRPSLWAAHLHSGA